MTQLHCLSQMVGFGPVNTLYAPPFVLRPQSCLGDIIYR